MQTKVMTVDDISPDTIRVVIDWDSLEVGRSMFIPCVDTAKAIEQVKKIAARKEYELKHHICVEDKLLGVRFWRTV